MDVMDERDFMTFKFKMTFRRISYICNTLSSLYLVIKKSIGINLNIFMGYSHFKHKYLNLEVMLMP